MIDAVECELLSACAFFRKHRQSLEKAYYGFIKLYCRGPRMEACRRLHYFREHNRKPPDDMLPSGATYRPDSPSG